MRGEENRESSEEEEGEHGGDEDPVGEEVSYAGRKCRSAASSAGPDWNRHLVYDWTDL